MCVYAGYYEGNGVEKGKKKKESWESIYSQPIDEEKR